MAFLKNSLPSIAAGSYGFLLINFIPWNLVTLIPLSIVKCILLVVLLLILITLFVKWFFFSVGVCIWGGRR